jgi:hypothetical protein
VDRGVAFVNTPVVHLLCSEPAAGVKAAAGTPAAPLPYSTSVAVSRVVGDKRGRQGPPADIVAPRRSDVTGGTGS